MKTAKEWLDLVSPFKNKSQKDALIELEVAMQNYAFTVAKQALSDAVKTKDAYGCACNLPHVILSTEIKTP